MAKLEISYKSALTEIEEILNKIEEGEMDVDELTQNVKRVTELLKICKDKLHKAESEVTKILDKD